MRLGPRVGGVFTAFEVQRFVPLLRLPSLSHINKQRNELIHKYTYEYIYICMYIYEDR